MPLCVHCGSLAKSLYATYGPTNIVCTPCSECQRFADPYLEHDVILVILDLILVKPRAYRHLLFNNRERKPLQPGPSQWKVLLRRMTAVLLIDAYIRWYKLCAQGNNQFEPSELAPFRLSFEPLDQIVAALVPSAATAEHVPLALTSFFRVLLATCLETLALHATILTLVTIHRRFVKRDVSHPLSRVPSPSPFDKGEPLQTPITPTAQSFASHLHTPEVGDGAETLYESHHVPAALLFSGLTPILLLLLNLLWEARMPPVAPLPPRALSTVDGPMVWTAAQPLTTLVHAYDRLLLSMEDASREMTIEWAVRNLIGGVSAGVAIAVLMPSRPLATVLFLTAGWYAQGAVGALLATDESRLWCGA